MQNDNMVAVLAAAAKQAGFSISDVTIEAEGICSRCAGAGAGAGRARTNVAQRSRV